MFDLDTPAYMNGPQMNAPVPAVSAVPMAPHPPSVGTQYGMPIIPNTVPSPSSLVLQQAAGPYMRHGVAGPGIPVPGQNAYAMQASPNWGAPVTELSRWMGTGGWVYALYSDGALKVVSEPKHKSDGTWVTRNSAPYIAVLEEYLKLNPAGPLAGHAKVYIGIAKGKNVGGSSTVQNIVAQLTGGAPISLPSAPATVTAAQAASAAGSEASGEVGYSTKTKALIAVGALAVVLGLGSGAFLLWRRK